MRGKNHGVKIWRVKKNEDGQWPMVDDFVSDVRVGSFATTRKAEQVLEAIPGEHHFAMPLGAHAQEFTIGFDWVEKDQLAASPTSSYMAVLKQWDCSAVYYIQLRYTSMFNDIWPLEQYVVCKQITTNREAPGICGVQATSPYRKYGRWKVTMNCLAAPSPSREICPAFEPPTVANTVTVRTNKVGLKLQNIVTGQYFDRPMTKIQVTHTTQPQEFAIPNEVPLVVLPPLGSVGPVIEVEFRTRTDAEYVGFRQWVTGASDSQNVGDTVVKVMATSYEEFDLDVDGGGSVHSKWVVSNIGLKRTPGSGGSYDYSVATIVGDGQVNERTISMTLTRYWKWELM